MNTYIENIEIAHEMAHVENLQLLCEPWYEKMSPALELLGIDDMDMYEEIMFFEDLYISMRESLLPVLEQLPDDLTLDDYQAHAENDVANILDGTVLYMEKFDGPKLFALASIYFLRTWMITHPEDYAHIR